MRIIVTAALTLLFLAPSAVSGQIQLGATAGVAFTNFLGDSDPEFESKTNFAGGFTFAHQLNRNVSIRPELLYVRKGAKTQTEIDGVLSNVSFSIIYLEVPAMLRYSVSPRSGLSPVFAVGPVVSWNIDAHVTFGAVDGELEQTESDSSIKGFDFGVAGELATDIKWDLRTITIGARFTYGLSNLIDNPDDPKHNGALTIMAGIGL